MFRLKAYQIAKIEREVRVPLTGTRSYLVTVSQGATFVKPAFSNGAKLDCSPIDWCHNLIPRQSLDHAPTFSDDEFLESLPEAEVQAGADEGGGIPLDLTKPGDKGQMDEAWYENLSESDPLRINRGGTSVSNIAREEERPA